jgi:hypothetical protein
MSTYWYAKQPSDQSYEFVVAELTRIKANCWYNQHPMQIRREFSRIPDRHSLAASSGSLSSNTMGNSYIDCWQDSQQKHEFDPQIRSYWQSVQEEQDQCDIRRNSLME